MGKKDLISLIELVESKGYSKKDLIFRFGYKEKELNKMIKKIEERFGYVYHQDKDDPDSWYFLPSD